MTTSTAHVLDIYGTHLHLVTSRKQWKAVAKTVPDLGEFPDNLGAVHTRTVEPDEGGYDQHHVVIFINTGPREHQPAKFAGAVAHEATHAAAHIFGKIGADLDYEDEPFAWLVDWLVTWITGEVA